MRSVGYAIFSECSGTLIFVDSESVTYKELYSSAFCTCSLYVGLEALKKLPEDLQWQLVLQPLLEWYVHYAASSVVLLVDGSSIYVGVATD